jgi:hypothetical protein
MPKSVVVVDSLADLRSVKADAALARFHSVDGDGGGGAFVWSDVAELDDGGVALNSQPNGPGWRRLHSGPLDIRWFGASPSLVDNSDAILRTFDAAVRRGRAVLVPEGVFRHSRTLTLPEGPFRLTGVGRGSVLLLDNLETDAALETAPQSADYEICSLWLQTTVPNAVALRLVAAFDVTVENVSFRSPGDARWTAGIELVDSATNPGHSNNAFVSILGCNISLCQVGVHFNCAGAFSIYLRGNHIVANSSWGIYAPKPGLPHSIHVVSNDLEGNGVGGLYADALWSSSIEGNYFEYPASAATAAPLQLGKEGQCQGVSIRNNLFSVEREACIDLRTTSSQGIEIAGNRFESHTPKALALILLGNLVNVSIHNNVADCLVPLYQLQGPLASLSVQDHATVWTSDSATGVAPVTGAVSVKDATGSLIVAEADGTVVTLPAESWLPGRGPVPLEVGRQFTVKNLSAGTVTVSAGGNGLIDRSPTQSIGPYGSLTVVSIAVVSIDARPSWAVVGRS